MDTTPGAQPRARTTALSFYCDDTSPAIAGVKAFESFLDFAVRHRVIIERFGRFPHRNDLLGRASTAEERAFLEQPGSSF